MTHISTVRSFWKPVLLGSIISVGASLALPAQNATSGGDQRPQPDAQSSGSQRGPGSGTGQGGRRGGGIRGTVTAVNGSTVMLKTEAGETWTAVSTDNTRVRRDGQQGTVSGIQPGDELMAMGIPDADKHEIHAVMLAGVSAAEVAKAKANLGKTYIVGRITAINDTQLTVMRSDRVSQTITLDESTSLHRGGRPNGQAMAAAGLDMGMLGPGGGYGGRRGGNGGNAGGGAPPDENGESITLADVKVGDTVAGTGALKGTAFVPTDLHVMERPAGGRRGAGGDTVPPQ